MKYAFIGAGKMASAIIHGMLRGKVCNASDIFVSCPEPELLQTLSDATAVQILTSNAEVAAAAPVVILCVKPQDAAKALAQTEDNLSGKLLISIAADDHPINHGPEFRIFLFYRFPAREGFAGRRTLENDPRAMGWKARATPERARSSRAPTKADDNAASCKKVRCAPAAVGSHFGIGIAAQPRLPEQCWYHPCATTQPRPPKQKKS